MSIDLKKLENETQSVRKRVDSIDEQLKTVNSALTEMKRLIGEIRANSSNTIAKSLVDTVNDSNDIKSSQPNSLDAYDNECEALRKKNKEKQEALDKAEQQVRELKEEKSKLSKDFETKKSELNEFIISLNSILGNQDEKPTIENIENNLKQILKELKDEIKEGEDEMGRFLGFISKIFGVDNNCSTMQERKKRAKEILENKNSEIGDLRKTIKSKEEEIFRLTSTIAAKDNEIAKLKETIKSKEDEIFRLTSTIAVKNNEIAKLNETIKSKEEEILRLNSTIAVKDNEIAKLNRTIKSKEEEIVRLNSTVAAKNNEIARLNRTIQSNKNEISDLNGTIAARNNTIDELDGIVTEYSDATIDFLKIFKLMQSCLSLKDLVEDEFALPSQGDLNIQQKIQFVNCFSDKTYFAECIYKALEKYQRGNGVPLTDSEKELIKAVNNHYKSVFDMNWDILDCLCIEKGTKFNKELMKNAKDPMNTFLSEVDYLCVPSLRNLESKIVEKAYIVGR